MILKKLKKIIGFIKSKDIYTPLSRLYMLNIDDDFEELKMQQQKYSELIDRFIEIFGEREDIFIISAPGRTEIGGNHTDHNNGMVLSAAVNLDILVVTSKNQTGIVNLYSNEFQKNFKILTSDLSKKKNEAGTPESLIRGILKSLKDKNYKIGGFDAFLASSIPEGSGLSSSAAFEVAITEIINQLYNDGELDKTEIAKISRYAENVYFEKPCGLMDQLTSCYGGLLKIDFKDIENPIINRLDFNFSDINYRLCIVNTGSSHSNLTDEYSSITREMKSIANYYNFPNCRGIQYKKFIEDLPELRKRFGDRAVLRVLHFLNENRRVELQVDALEKENFQEFLKLFEESGNSSFKWLQNIYSCNDVEHQGITLALAIAENVYPQNVIARVHGGGFAGTIQVFVKMNVFDELSKLYKNVFGSNSFYPIAIRDLGSILVNKLFK